MCIIAALRCMITIRSTWGISGWGSRGIRLFGGLGGIFWGRSESFPWAGGGGSGRGWLQPLADIFGYRIFDYWWDTTSNMIEHYADGDLVNKDTPVGYGKAGHESLAVWGPEVPTWFLD
jgi:hypothetical protein